MKKNVLFTWLGTNDLNDPVCLSDQYGAITSILLSSGIRFERLIILSNRNSKKISDYQKWLFNFLNHKSLKIKIDMHWCTDNDDPTDYRFIYEQSELAIRPFIEGYQIHFNVTSGTSAMSANWLLLGTSIYNAILWQSSKEKGVERVLLPYDISIRAKQDRVIESLTDVERYSEAFRDILGRSEIMNNVIQMANIISTRNVPVLIQGETGTGKEVFAQAIHAASLRRDKPFIAVNCGAIAESLIDSEFFGHKKGAFTGADQNRQGHFESADGGTLFLDELGELSLTAQVKLLRVLQQKEIVRVGESQARKIDVRIIAATHRNLMEMVRDGTFREDLFFRLAVGVIDLPALRERGEDLIYLSHQLLVRINQELMNSSFKVKKLSQSALDFIAHQYWPGNVRELYNTLLRAAVWNQDIKELTEMHIKAALLDFGMYKSKEQFEVRLPVDLPQMIDKIKREYIKAALAENNHNKSKAIQRLCLKNTQTLDNWFK